MDLNPFPVAQASPWVPSSAVNASSGGFTMSAVLLFISGAFLFALQRFLSFRSRVRHNEALIIAALNNIDARLDGFESRLLMIEETTSTILRIENGMSGHPKS